MWSITNIRFSVQRRLQTQIIYTGNDYVRPRAVRILDVEWKCVASVKHILNVAINVNILCLVNLAIIFKYIRPTLGVEIKNVYMALCWARQIIYIYMNSFEKDFGIFAETSPSIILTFFFCCRRRRMLEKSYIRNATRIKWNIQRCIHWLLVKLVLCRNDEVGHVYLLI